MFRQKWRRGAPPPFFSGAFKSGVTRFTKNGEEGHPRLFSRFLGSTSKAVSRFIKNEEEGHRACFWAHPVSRPFYGFAQLKRCHASSKMKTGP